jgi:hypothetical protein
MKPLVLAVSLCLTACAHASPLVAAASVVSARLAPSPEQQAAGLVSVAALDVAVKPHASVASVAHAAAPVALEAAREALASAPVVAAAVASAPGPLGVLLGVWEGIKANPALDGVFLLALIGAFFALALFFHWISPEKARKWIPFLRMISDFLGPVSQATPTPLDDVLEMGVQKALAELLKLAAQGDAEAAATLAAAHEAAGLPAPVLTPTPAQV